MMQCIAYTIFFDFSPRMKLGFMTLMPDHGRLDLALRQREKIMVAFPSRAITRLQMLLLREVSSQGPHINPQLSFPRQKY